MCCWSGGLDRPGGRSAAVNSSKEPNAGAAFLGQSERTNPEGVSSEVGRSFSQYSTDVEESRIRENPPD